MRARLVLALGCSLLAACGRVLYQTSDAASVGLDAPGLDAPGPDAPGPDAPGRDAPGLDAPVVDAALDAFSSPPDAPPRADAPPEILCGGAGALTSYADLGTGAPSDPYVICNQAQWESFLTDGPGSASYRLGADLDIASDIRGSSLMGELDGGGHVVVNHAFWTGPLFASLVGGSVHDLRLQTNVDAQTTDQVGAIAGSATGSVLRVTVLADFVTGADETGGLLGTCTGCTVSDSSVSISRISGMADVGGVVGHMTGGEIRRTRSSVLQLDSRLATGCANLGGIVGSMAAGGTVSESYAESTLVGLGVGGIVGDAGLGADVHDVVALGQYTAMGSGCSFAAAGVAGNGNGVIARGWTKIANVSAGIADHLGIGASVSDFAAVHGAVPTVYLVARSCDAGTSATNVVAFDDGSGGLGVSMCSLAPAATVATEMYFWSPANAPMSSWSAAVWSFSSSGLPTLRNLPP
ncbi:MAG: hypothetical protein U0353_17240 [Sandaracinus sp.]